MASNTLSSAKVHPALFVTIAITFIASSVASDRVHANAAFRIIAVGVVTALVAFTTLRYVHHASVVHPERYRMPRVPVVLGTLLWTAALVAASLIQYALRLTFG